MAIVFIPTGIKQVYFDLDSIFLPKQNLSLNENWKFKYCLYDLNLEPRIKKDNAVVGVNIRSKDRNDLAFHY